MSLSVVTSKRVADFLKDQDLLSYWSLTGKVWTASASAPNTTVTGQTSFSATTPTFLLDIPSGVTVVPLLMALAQTGSVAGGDISVVMAKDYEDRYDSGGTEATYLNDRSSLVATTPSSHLYTGATATADTNNDPVRMQGITLAPDVSPAEGVINENVWTPAGALDWLDGPAAWIVYTWAASTGPTWWWTFKFAEFTTTELS